MFKSRTLLLHAVSNEQDARRQPYAYISESQLKSLVEIVFEMNLIGYTIEFSFDDGHESVAHAVELIREVSEEIKIRVFIPTFIFERPNTENLDKRDIYNLSQHKNLTIGSHGHYHRPLTRLSRTELRAELIRSKAILEDMLTQQVSSISYPYGEMNSQVREVASTVGFKQGYTSFWGINTMKTDSLSFHRIQILGTESRELLFRKLGRPFYVRGILQKIRYSDRFF